MGPATVGSVKSISLTPNGQAQVTMSIDSSAAPLHEGTVARIYENSLSGIANKYVVLEPGATRGAGHPGRRDDRREPHVLVREPGSGVRRARPAHPGRPAGRDPGRGGEHPGQVGAGEQDAQVPGARAGQHEQPDRRARPQRAGVRRPARAGRAGHAGAGLAQPAALRSDRPDGHDDRRDRRPGPEPRAGAPAPARHADPRHRHVRRAATPRSTRSIRWSPSPRSPRAGSPRSRRASRRSRRRRSRPSPRSAR